LFHYPFRYEDFSNILPINELTAGITTTVQGKIELISTRRSPVKKKLLTEAVISDKSGSVKVIWFHQPYLTKVLKTGDEIYLSGKTNFDRYDIQLVNPIYEKVKKETLHTARLIPIYPLTERLTQKQIRFLINSVLSLAEDIDDLLPKNILKSHKFIGINDAIKQIHFPKDYNQVKSALQRLKFDELLLLQLQVQLSRQELEKSNSSPITFKKRKTQDFVNSLPFNLTNDQRKTSWEILQDLQETKPMNRLLEGEVGSGKTIVAAIALLNVVLNKKQVVFMAPTEILAKQHYKTLKDLFCDKPINICLVTRTQISHNKQKEEKTTKTKIITKIKKGEVDVIVGTHSLIQEKMDFSDLSLVIVDEQHRFGVKQRKTLKDKSGDKNTFPHFLSMTATPIPRTLALSLYGDLDISIIKELPKERKKIITQIISPKDRSKAYKFIEEKIKEGRQAFVVCPLIDPSDKLGVKSVTEEYEKLNTEVFPKLKIGLLHGKLKTEAKEEVMNDFIKNKINILVSTSVVEVGVDIHQSYCILFTESFSKKIKDRMQALVDYNDGFKLAEKDLEFRGPGQIYGTVQSGYIASLKLASLSDYELIKIAKAESHKLLNISPDLNKFPKLQERILNIQNTVHWE